MTKPKTMTSSNQLMEDLEQPIQNLVSIQLKEAVAFATEIGYPVIVRPAFTLGGTGGGMCQRRRTS